MFKIKPRHLNICWENLQNLHCYILSENKLLRPWWKMCTKELKTKQRIISEMVCVRFRLSVAPSSLADPRRGVRDVPPPLSPISFIFMTFSANIWPNYRLAHSLREILDPTLQVNSFAIRTSVTKACYRFVDTDYSYPYQTTKSTN